MYHLSLPRVVDGKSCSIVWKRSVVSSAVGVVRAILKCGCRGFRSSFVLRLDLDCRKVNMLDVSSSMVSLLRARKELGQSKHACICGPGRFC